MGLVEELADSELVPLTLPAGGNVAISGGTLSGKVFLVRTIVLSMVLTHAPDELNFYFVGVTSGPSGADVLSALPHVATADTFQEAELVGVIIHDLHTPLRERDGHRYIARERCRTLNNA